QTKGEYDLQTTLSIIGALLLTLLGILLFTGTL
ncbi:unnamed protein product, partial [marine sediment metagenome]